MENIYKNQWNHKSITLLAVLVLLPNLLGIINIPTSLGFSIHLFQIAIFLAALIYGPWAGLLSGAVGSAYSAIMMNNPYIIVGNMILGFFVGYFFSKKMHTLIAVGLAFIIQLPWLIVSDHYFIGMPFNLVWMIVLALAVSNTLWGLVAHYTNRPIRNLVK